MNVRISALAVVIAGGMAMAQVAPSTPQKVGEQLRTGTAQAPPGPPSQVISVSAPALKPAAGQQPAGGTAAAPKRGAARSPFAGKPAPKAAPKAAPAKAAPRAASRPASSPAPEMAKSGARGRRDPFVSPIVRAAIGGGPALNCTTGKRCLSASDMRLRGVVKAGNGMIAVVENSAKKTYFLRENDPIFNGFVMKITGDSIILRENGTDNFGKPTTREVVKSVSAPAV